MEFNDAFKQYLNKVKRMKDQLSNLTEEATKNALIMPFFAMLRYDVFNTDSTRMSAAGARQEDIIALMGHTNFDVDINHYINQETDTLYNAIMKMA